MIRRKSGYSLGSAGIFELKDHPWFENFPWSNLEKRTLKAPFVPRTGDNFDKKYCEGVDKIGVDTIDRFQKLQSAVEFNNIFLNYTFLSQDIKSAIHKKPESKYIIINKSSKVDIKSKLCSPLRTKKNIEIEKFKTPKPKLKSALDTPRSNIKLPPIDMRKLSENKLIASSSTKSMLKNNSTRSSLDGNIMFIHKRTSSLIDKKFK